jgi:hypothetical protein
MTFVNPSPHLALPPPLAQPHVLNPRSDHAPTQVREAVRATQKIARMHPHHQDEQSAQQGDESDPKRHIVDVMV